MLNSFYPHFPHPPGRNRYVRAEAFPFILPSFQPIITKCHFEVILNVVDLL